MEWSEKFNIGIDVIDNQHRQILDYINALEKIRATGAAREQIKDVFDDLIDYTQSHFSFEENLLAQVNYQFLPSHRSIHELFVKRLKDFRQRFDNGESVEDDLHRLLSKWLINHIQHDDQDYIDAVRDNMLHYLRSQEQKKAKVGLRDGFVKYLVVFQKYAGIKRIHY